MTKREIAIFTPMANEEKNAEKFINDILSYSKHFDNFMYFIIMDKVSKDNTFSIVKNIEKSNQCLKVIWSPENKCIVDAYLKGYKTCINTGYKWILEIDAGSHNPKNIDNFMPFINSEFDCLYGSRFCQDGKMINDNTSGIFYMLRILLSKGGTILSKLFFKINLKDTTSGFQMFRINTLKLLLNKKIISRDRFFQTEIKIYTRKLKLKEVPIEYKCTSNSKKFPLLAIFESLCLLVKIKFSKNNYI